MYFSFLNFYLATGQTDHTDFTNTVWQQLSVLSRILQKSLNLSSSVLFKGGSSSSTNLVFFDELQLLLLMSSKHYWCWTDFPGNLKGILICTFYNLQSSYRPLTQEKYSWWWQVILPLWFLIFFFFTWADRSTSVTWSLCLSMSKLLLFCFCFFKLEVLPTNLLH